MLKSENTEKTSVPVPTSVPSVVRKPQQARGRERVETILDAAAALIAEGGLANLTTHGLAKRAQTSIGSMYHFFPDRDSVLYALMDRHAAGMQEITGQFEKIPLTTWKRLAPKSVIERLLTPYLDYLQHHKDFLPVTQGLRFPESDTSFTHLMEGILAIRLPNATPAAIEIYARMLHAIVIGTVSAAFRTDPTRIGVWLEETQRLLTLYLTEIETGNPTIFNG